MKTPDCLQRFIFENSHVRGEHVQLDRSIQEIIGQRKYPLVISKYLRQIAVVACLLSATIKFKGRLTIQFQSSGAFSLLVAQYTHDRRIRALARFDETKASGDFKKCFEQGELVVSVLQDNQTVAYQSIVPLSGKSVAQAMEDYFFQSVQLPTKIFIATRVKQGVGFLLQKLPDTKLEAKEEILWEHVITLANTLTEKELLALDLSNLLFRLFQEESIRIFAPEKIKFSCNCSKFRMEGPVGMMGEEEAMSLLSTHKMIEVTCDFCGESYRFERQEVEAIFSTKNCH
jgi:molecular chaperone Hsp33